MTFTKHNDLELQAQGVEGWGNGMNTNFGLMELGATIKGVTGLTVSAGEVGYFTSDFKFEKALADVVGTLSSEWAGFFTTDIGQGIQGFARHTGYISSPNWSFTSGPVYLSDSTAGAITQTAPSVESRYMVGWAIQTNEILIKPWSPPPAQAVAVGEGHIVLFPFNYQTRDAGNWEDVTNTNQELNYYTRNEDSNDLDSFTMNAYLAAGTYSAKILYVKSSSGGMFELLIDDVSVWSGVDTYASSAAWSQHSSTTGIVVASEGLKTLKIRSNGKNGSSSAYRIHLSVLEMWRTPNLFLDVSESITVAEFEEVLITPLFINVSEPITVAEDVTLGLIHSIDVSDSVTVADFGAV